MSDEEPEPEPEVEVQGLDFEAARRKSEKRTVQSLDTTKKVRHWFIIESSWLADWRSYVSGGDRPDPIDNAHLLEADPHGVYAAREGLTKAEDYRAVNDSVWAYFQKV